jgi:AbrB family looped-hinge helix DNA binding protein
LAITFTARMQEIGRVAVPKAIREELGIKPGDLVTVTIERARADR